MRLVTELNIARLRGSLIPIVHSLIEASLPMYVRPLVYPTFHSVTSHSNDSNFHILAEITEERPALRTRNTSVLALPPSHTRDPRENHFVFIGGLFEYLYSNTVYYYI
jgi:hypothetical protein